MSAKVWAGQKVQIKKTWDFSVHGGAVGTIALGNLPDGFIITDCYANATTAPVGGGSMVVGEDGSGDADGYFTDLDALAVAVPLKGTGALVWAPPATDAADIGNEIAFKVAAAKDGVLMTIATTAYTAGVIEFSFNGYQG